MQVEPAIAHCYLFPFSDFAGDLVIRLNHPIRLLSYDNGRHSSLLLTIISPRAILARSLLYNAIESPLLAHVVKIGLCSINNMTTRQASLEASLSFLRSVELGFRLL